VPLLNTSFPLIRCFPLSAKRYILPLLYSCPLSLSVLGVSGVASSLFCTLLSSGRTIFKTISMAGLLGTVFVAETVYFTTSEFNILFLIALYSVFRNFAMSSLPSSVMPLMSKGMGLPLYLQTTHCLKPVGLR